MTKVNEASKKFVRIDVDEYVNVCQPVNDTGTNLNALTTSDSPQKFRCKLCYNTFFYLESYTRHLKKHEKPLKCRHCDFVAYAKVAMSRHLTKHGIGKKTYKCRYCEEIFQYAATRISHENKHIGKMFTCQICCSQFSSIGKLNTHEKSHPQLNRFTCDLCCKAFPYNYMYKQHLKTRHTLNKTPSENLVSIFRCKFCGKGFRNVDWYKIHEARHKGELIYGDMDQKSTFFSWHLHFQQECNFCGSYVQNIEELRAHLLSAHSELLGVKDFSHLETCHFCGKDMNMLHFKNEKFLHVIKHLNIIPFKCNICNFRTSWVKSLRRHLGMSHLSDSLYSCDACNQTFQKKITFLEHMRDQHNICALQEYLCDFCGQTIIGKQKIKSHKTKCRETSESVNKETYSCDICKKNFSQYKHLTIHKESCHVNLHTCKECGIVYDNIDFLNQHKLLFSLERVCSECDFKAEHGTFLSQHIVTCHPEFSFLCDICGINTASSICYYKHLKSHRKEEISDDSIDKLYIPSYDSDEEALFQLERKSNRNNVFIPGSNNSNLFFECCHCGAQFATSNECIAHEHIHNEYHIKDKLIIDSNNKSADLSKIASEITVLAESTLEERDYEVTTVDDSIPSVILTKNYSKFLPVNHETESESETYINYIQSEKKKIDEGTHITRDIFSKIRNSTIKTTKKNTSDACISNLKKQLNCTNSSIKISNLLIGFVELQCFK